MIDDDLNDIISTLIKQHVGGEKFFKYLDEAIRKENIIDRLLIEALCDMGGEEMARKNFVVSGDFGVYFLGVFPGFLDKTLHVNGCLRDGEIMDISPFEDMIRGNDFIFFDDSYYSGKTMRKIEKELHKYGGKITDVYVVYDGAEKKEHVLEV